MTSRSTRRLGLLAAAFVALTACSAENIADNTADVTIFLGKTAAKAAVEAGKLVFKGGKLAVQAARDSTAGPTDFPPGTVICQNAQGGYYEALEATDGSFYCLPKEDAA